jgi:hypothetical protein
LWPVVSIGHEHTHQVLKLIIGVQNFASVSSTTECNVARTGESGQPCSRKGAVAELDEAGRVVTPQGQPPLPALRRERPGAPVGGPRGRACDRESGRPGCSSRAKEHNEIEASIDAIVLHTSYELV